MHIKRMGFLRVWAVLFLLPGAVQAEAAGGEEEEELPVRLLSEMSVESKAGQIVMPWIPGGVEEGSMWWNRAMAWVEEEGVGGFLVGRGDFEKTKKLLRALQEKSDIPLLFAGDFEWGAGMRLTGTTEMVMPMALGATGEPTLAYLQGYITAVEARAAGFHISFSPVADVNSNPANPIINTRAFGEDPDFVGDMVTAFIQGLRAGGLLSVAKHFPGHGDTNQDSHLELPLVSRSRALLESVDLVPFQRAVGAGVEGIMTAHLRVPAFGADSIPATFSSAILRDLLGERMGFKGAVFTDALTMKALDAWPEDSVVVYALRGGSHVLLQPRSVKRAVRAVEIGVAGGGIDMRSLDEALGRVMDLKLKAGLFSLDEKARLTGEGIDASGKRGRVVDLIVERSITLLQDKGEMLPLSFATPVDVVVYAPHGRSRDGGSVISELTRAGVSIGNVHRLTKAAGPIKVSSVLTDLRFGSGVLLFLSFVEPVAGVRSIEAPPAINHLLEQAALQGRVILASFGNPYLAAERQDLDVHLLAWGRGGVTERGVANALLGRVDFQGTSPVSLSAQYPRGSGLKASFGMFGRKVSFEDFLSSKSKKSQGPQELYLACTAREVAFGYRWPEILRSFPRPMRKG